MVQLFGDNCYNLSVVHVAICHLMYLYMHAYNMYYVSYMYITVEYNMAEEVGKCWPFLIKWLSSVTFMQWSTYVCDLEWHKGSSCTFLFLYSKTGQNLNLDKMFLFLYKLPLHLMYFLPCKSFSIHSYEVYLKGLNLIFKHVFL